MGIGPVVGCCCTESKSGGSSLVVVADALPLVTDGPELEDSFPDKDEWDDVCAFHSKCFPATTLAAAGTMSSEQSTRASSMATGPNTPQSILVSDSGEAGGGQDYEVGEFEVVLERHSAKHKVGMLMYSLTDEECIRVRLVREGRLTHDWNVANPSKVVRPGDAIVEVNGVTDADSMRSMFEDLHVKTLVLKIHPERLRPLSVPLEEPAADDAVAESREGT
mmetsp:Transcript_18020/g.42111  ORF Transcript_18020/g.42111 Transcript_18020/m.42111 type:complete len:221 (+) Transcript_18020:113-775(+)